MPFEEGKFVINAQADKIWKTVSGFAKVEEYIPVMKSSRLEDSGVGATRYIKCEMSDGNKHDITERLEFVDESQRMLKFRVVKAIPAFENAVVTIQVTPLENNKSEFYTSCEIDTTPISKEEFKAICSETFKTEAEGLEKLHRN